jgi:hypothetical protein
MVRTQVQLTDEQYNALKELSQHNKESIAAIIRKAIDKLLLTRKPDRNALYRQAKSIVGKYNSGIGDISVEHDRYLDEAFKE